MSALTIAGFEFRSRLKLISTWVYFLVFFSLALLWIAAAGGLFKDANISFGSGKVAVNSPFALAQTVAILGMFGITVMAAIMGRAVQQDVEYRTQSFFFTAPIGKLEYLGGRFLGALGVLLVVFTSLGLGAFLATLLPGMDAERLGANRWAAYLSPYAQRAAAERAGDRRGLLQPRRGDEEDAAGLHRQRAGADRLADRAAAGARCRQPRHGGADRPVRPARGQRPHRILDDLRAQPASWCRSKACCSGTGCSGSASARSSSPSASGASRFAETAAARRGQAQQGRGRPGRQRAGDLRPAGRADPPRRGRAPRAGGAPGACCRTASGSSSARPRRTSTSACSCSPALLFLIFASTTRRRPSTAPAPGR